MMNSEPCEAEGISSCRKAVDRNTHTHVVFLHVGQSRLRTQSM